MFLSN